MNLPRIGKTGLNQFVHGIATSPRKPDWAGLVYFKPMNSKAGWVF
jgi:hypothetical protein